jgi:hypothetical protein
MWTVDVDDDPDVLRAGERDLRRIAEIVTRPSTTPISIIVG